MTQADVATSEASRCVRTIAGATSTLRIGRDVVFDKQWIENSDTRIPPGGTTMARAWSTGRVALATHARITVEVHPDAFFEGMYTTRLRAKLPDATRKQYETALARARASRFVAEQRALAISRIVPTMQR